MTDTPVIALTACIILLLIRRNVFLSLRRAALLGALIGLSILSRTIAPSYYIFPCIVAFLIDAHSTLLRCGRNYTVVLGKLLLCSLLTLIIIIAVAGPWHAYQHAALEEFWFRLHPGTKGQPVALFQKDEQVCNSPALGAEGILPKRQSSDKGAQTDGAQKKNRTSHNLSVPWISYPVHINNNVLFFPLFALFLLGSIQSLMRYRRCSYSEVFVLCWIAGGWVILTLTFTIATPRYSLPFAAGLSLLSAYSIVRIPWKWTRRVLAGSLLAVLLHGYACLTFSGSVAEATGLYMPVFPVPRILAKYDDAGLCIYKSRIALGEAYTWLGGPEIENYRDRIFSTIVRHERQTEIPRGGRAQIGVVNMRGLDFEPSRYWPGTPAIPNRLFDRSLPEELHAPRELALLARVDDMRDFIELSETLDYIVSASDTSTEDSQTDWNKWIRDHSFILLDTFSHPRRGTVSARTFHIYAREGMVGYPDMAALAQMDRFELLDLLNYLPRSNDLHNPIIMCARSELDRIMTAHPSQTAIGKCLDIHDAEMRQCADSWITCRLLFRVTAILTEDIGMFFQGVTVQAGGVMRASSIRQIPLLPARYWVPGDYAMVKFRFPGEPMPDYCDIYIQEGVPDSQYIKVRLSTRTLWSDE